MNPIKTGLFAVITGGLLLGISGSLGGSSVFADSGPGAQPVRSSSIASVACQAVDGGWTDCAATLNQGVGAGDEVAVAIPSSDGTATYCDAGPSSGGDEGYAGCGLSGNTVVFDGDDGYVAGTQLDFSILDTSAMPSDSQLAQQITVTAGSPATETMPGS